MLHRGEHMVKDGWVYCPICNNKTRTKIRPDTVARNLPVFCPKCKNVSVMSFENGKPLKDETIQRMG